MTLTDKLLVAVGFLQFLGLIGQIVVYTHQAKIMNNSVKINRDMLISTFRPRIVVHQLSLEAYVPGKNLAINVAFVNIGDSKAIINMIIGTIAISPPGRTLSYMDGAQNCLITEKEIPTGHISFTTISNSTPVTQQEIDDIHADRQQLYCVGMITYSDERGTTRRTGFNRQLFGPSRVFKVSEDKQTEFAY